ncbi:MAG: hypothetical protein KHW87_02210 [Clostridiales bacterium]|nr:hypothetical protein [Clostridiales bacterium]
MEERENKESPRKNGRAWEKTRRRLCRGDVIAVLNKCLPCHGSGGCG